MKTSERKQLGLEKAHQFSNGLGSAVEVMAGENVKTAVLEAGRAAWQKGGTALALRCTFGFTEAPLWVIAEEETWSEIANAAVTGAGIEDADTDLRKQTWRELISQAANLLIADRSEDPSARLSVEALPLASVEEASEVFAIEATFGAKSFRSFHVSISHALIEALNGEEEVAGQHVGLQVPSTLDRLLDVELPLTVAFGRTNLPVQEIVKLSSGSIIELNCPANDLVDIVVNNCMIARGEVVVIEGNYGVRVREIISRSERMALPNAKGGSPEVMRLTA